MLMFCSTCRIWHSSLVNLAIKHVSRSDIIFLEMPKCGNTHWAYSVATPFASICSLQDRKSEALEHP